MYVTVYFVLFIHTTVLINLGLNLATNRLFLCITFKHICCTDIAYESLEHLNQRHYLEHVEEIEDIDAFEKLFFTVNILLCANFVASYIC